MVNIRHWVSVEVIQGLFLGGKTQSSQVETEDAGNAKQSHKIEEREHGAGREGQDAD